MIATLTKRTSYIFRTLLICVLSFAYLPAKEPAGYSKDQLTDLFINELQKAQLHVRGQNLMLEAIKTAHPELSNKADEAWTAFDLSEFGTGYRNIDSIVIAKLKDEPAGLSWFRKQNADAEKQFEKLLKEQPALDLANAGKFIDMAMLRAYGAFTPESTAHALMAANPKFQGEPSLEMAAGFKRKMSTNGHGKSKGRSISFEIPTSWSRTEGNGKNVVMVCRSDAGYGDIDLNILLADMELPIDTTAGAGKGAKRLLNQLEYEASLKSYNEETQAPEGFRAVRKEIIKVNDLSWCLFVTESDAQDKYAGRKTRLFQFTTLHNSHVVLITFHLWAKAQVDLNALEEKYKGAIKNILSTVKFDDEIARPKWADSTYAVFKTNAPLRIGKKTVSLIVPKGMACVDRSTDLMPEYVKAHFKDLMKGTQMLTFVDSNNLGENPSNSVLVLDGKLEPKDIKEQLSLTEKTMKDKAKVAELSGRGNASLAKAGYYSPEDIAMLSSRANGKFITSIIQNDGRHFLVKIEGGDYTNYMATMACESRMVLLNSQGPKDTAAARESQMRALIDQLNAGFEGEDPNYKTPPQSKTITSESGSFSYVLPLTWTTQSAPGVAEKMANFLLHGYKGQVCSIIFIERSLPGGTIDRVLASDMAEISASYKQQIQFSDIQKDKETAKGIPYSESTLLYKSDKTPGDVLQTLYVLKLKNDIFVTAIFSTKPDRNKVFTENAKQILDSLTPIAR
jgi:hypothetical protein